MGGVAHSKPSTRCAESVNLILENTYVMIRKEFIMKNLYIIERTRRSRDQTYTRGRLNERVNPYWALLFSLIVHTATESGGGGGLENDRYA